MAELVEDFGEGEGEAFGHAGEGDEEDGQAHDCSDGEADDEDVELGDGVAHQSHGEGDEGHGGEDRGADLEDEDEGLADEFPEEFEGGIGEEGVAQGESEVGIDEGADDEGRPADEQEDRGAEPVEQFPGEGGAGVEFGVEDFAEGDAGLLVDEVARELKGGHPDEDTQAQGEANEEFAGHLADEVEQRGGHEEARREIGEGEGVAGGETGFVAQAGQLGGEAWGRFVDFEQAVLVAVVAGEGGGRVDLVDHGGDDEANRGDEEHADLEGDGGVAEDGTEEKQPAETGDDQREGDEAEVGGGECGGEIHGCAEVKSQKAKVKSAQAWLGVVGGRRSGVIDGLEGGDFGCWGCRRDCCSCCPGPVVDQGCASWASSRGMVQERQVPWRDCSRGTTTFAF